jgi:hypothetical protein
MLGGMPWAIGDCHLWQRRRHDPHLCKYDQYYLCPTELSAVYAENPKGHDGSYQDFRYAYEANGNVQTIYDATVAANAGDQNFSYDDLDRPTMANGPYGTGGAPNTITYGYNQIGNILTNSQLTAGTFTYPTSGTGVVRPHPFRSPVPIRTVTTTMGTRRPSRVRSGITAPVRRLMSTIAWQVP